GEAFSPVVVLVTDLAVAGVAGEAAAAAAAEGAAAAAAVTGAQLGVFNPTDSERAAALALDGAGLDGEEVAGAGQQLIAFVLEGGRPARGGDEGAPAEDATAEGVDAEEPKPADRVRKLIIGSDEELGRLAEQDQERGEGRAETGGEGRRAEEPTV